MKLTVIGFWGAYPEKNEATSCFLLEEAGKSILLDCGSGAVAQLQNYLDLHTLDAVILSHYHHDHVADLGVLTYSRVVDINLNKTEKPLKIYAHKEDLTGFEKLGKPPFTEVTSYQLDSIVKFGPFTITFQKTDHPAPCYAMRIESSETNHTIVYTADTTFQESLIPFARNASLLIAETSFYADQSAEKFGHMNSREVAMLAKESETKEVVLSHLPHFGDHQQLVNEVAKTYSGEISLAETGKTWLL
ncbi:MBL fold metallo-hydrolase [Salipaludibacillus sp. CF4.18]|uniref:MBL fold metallo-hydrolase n=1 Tax=Salipaludibacillus sp. CF4.18 TaxID=3373081 RepID=UPI003EE646B7